MFTSMVPLPVGVMLQDANTPLRGSELVRLLVMLRTLLPRP